MTSATTSDVRTRSAKHSTDLLSTVAQQLARQLGSGTALSVQVLSKALHQVLDGTSAPALRARHHLQQHLLLLTQQEILGQALVNPAPSASAPMLTTQEAASLMGCSRPHVAMLIDTGVLDGAQRTPKGHRRVPLASVQQWLLEHPTVAPGGDTYRQAGQEAGMYDISVVDSAKAAARRSRD